MGLDYSQLVGRVIAQTYEVLGLIGSGGTGAVFEARHLRIGKHVALKVLSETSRSDAEIVQRFRREARIAADLGHPHIVDVHDFNESDDGLSYMVMQLLQGEDLEQLLAREGHLALERSAFIVQQTCSAVDAAHRHGVVHRDLKPANVFICTGEAHPDFVRVLDFGISKVLGSTSVLTTAAAILGTPHYMAPEQAAPSSGQIGPWTDVFAVGSMLYRLLAGRLPFAAETVPGVLYRIVHEQPTPLGGPPTNVARQVTEVLAKAMAKTPSDRYISLSDFANDLESAVPDAPRVSTWRSGVPAISATPSAATLGERPPGGAPNAAGLVSTLAASAAELKPGEHKTKRRPIRRPWVLGVAGTGVTVVLVALMWAGIGGRADNYPKESKRSPTRAAGRQTAPPQDSRIGATPAAQPRSEASSKPVGAALKRAAALEVRAVTITVAGGPVGARVIETATKRLLTRLPGSFSWPHSDKPLVLRVVRRGYHSRRTTLVPDHDQRLRVRLPRRQASPDLAQNPHL